MRLLYESSQGKQMWLVDEASSESGGVISRHRAIEAYAEEAGFTKEQAERALGLR